MSRQARTKLARAMRASTQKHTAAMLQYQGYAIVRSADPLQVELQDRGLVLGEDELVVSQWVRFYDYQHNLEVGDTLLVTQMRNGDFLAHDVISTQKIERGLDPDNDSGVAFSSRNGGIVARVPYLDDDGGIIGYVAVHNPLHGDAAP